MSGTLSERERRRKREEKLARREANRAGALWLRNELAHRAMSAHDLWERMLHFGTVGYSTVTAYTRGDIPIVEKADILARALGLDIAEIHAAASGIQSEELSQTQRLRLKARLAGIDADTPDEVASALGRLHDEIRYLMSLGYAPSRIVKTPESKPKTSPDNGNGFDDGDDDDQEKGDDDDDDAAESLIRIQARVL